jgi:hypothetical protein
MTDLLDAPETPPEVSSVPAESDRTTAEAAPTPRRPAPGEAPPRVVRWWVAATLVGAGAIHVATAPSHLGESAVEGAGFVVAAWAQLLLAAVVLVRPSRRALAAVVGTSLALVAAWGLSRISGLPFGAHAGHAESVSVVDGVCVGLEVVAVLAAALGLLRARPRLLQARILAVVGALGALALATGAVVSPSARDHAAGSHGDHASGAAGGHAHSDEPTADDAGFAALSNGHQHEHGQDEPLTPEERVTLATQLASTAELVASYPTIADAEAAGWRRAGPFSPGLGTHYRGPGYGLNPDGDMDPEDLAAPMLIYDGLEPDAPLAGFMYSAYGTAGEPEGFAGPNDHWHYHESVCIVMGEDGAIDTPFGADLEGVTEQMCTEVGGSFIDFTGYMVHVWNVPGYESPDGVFTELNPRIACPDGSYETIPTAELGDRDSTCRNP